PQSYATYAGFAVAIQLVAIVALVLWRIRARIAAVSELARQLREEQERAAKGGKAKALPEPEPETPAKREPAPVLAPGEKLVLEEKPRSLDEGLARTRDGFVGRIRSIVSGKTIDSSIVDELEEV